MNIQVIRYFCSKNCYKTAIGERRSTFRTVIECFHFINFLLHLKKPSMEKNYHILSVLRWHKISKWENLRIPSGSCQGDRVLFYSNERIWYFSTDIASRANDQRINISHPQTLSLLVYFYKRSPRCFTFFIMRRTAYYRSRRIRAIDERIGESRGFISRSGVERSRPCVCVFEFY